MSRLRALRKRIPLSTTAMLLLIVVINISIAGTLAYYNDKPAPVSNVMNPGFIENFEIVEDFEKPTGDTDDDAKKEVWIENGNTNSGLPVYTRVALVPVFRDGSNSYAGNVVYPGTGNVITVTSPDGATTIECNLATNWSNDWFYANGFFYHKKPVTNSDPSSKLLSNVEKNATGTWANFKIEILAEGIQTTGSVDEALKIWGVQKDGENIKPL